jgi:hypothetical protein
MIFFIVTLLSILFHPYYTKPKRILQARIHKKFTGCRFRRFYLKAAAPCRPAPQGYGCITAPPPPRRFPFVLSYAAALELTDAPDSIIIKGKEKPP